MYQVVSYSVYMNLVKANIAGNNKEYQYCRNKRKNAETMGKETLPQLTLEATSRVVQ